MQFVDEHTAANKFGMQNANIILIGMPGSGKTTVGRRLAKDLRYTFIDTDRLVERAVNMPIQKIVDNFGLRRFAQLEQRILCELAPSCSIIATGGSAVFSEAAMRHLGDYGTRLYLRISRQTMMRRITDKATRGLFKLPSHTLLRLYAERESMYPKYADLTFDNDKPFTAARAQLLHAHLASSSLAIYP